MVLWFGKHGLHGILSTLNNQRVFFNNPEALNILMTSSPINAYNVHRNMWLFQGLAKGYLSILFFLALSVNESVAMRPSTRRSTVTMTKVDTAQKVVILGAGIHGASVAHYLSSRFGIFPTVVERVSVAAAASGKAGGFLAREWGSGTTQQLHQVSFDMHEKLAEELKVESYRHVKTLSVDGNLKGKADAIWLDRQVTSSILDNGATTAQVTPLELTNKMMNAAIEKGAKLIFGAVEGVDIIEGKVTGVRVTGQETLPADKVIMCLGPWSGVMAEDWFGMALPMEGVKSTSVVYQDLDPIRTEPFACFCAEDKNGCHLELYPRPNGEVYICGCGGSDYVKGDRLRAGGDCETADMITADPKRVKAAGDSFREMTSLGDKKPDQIQACMRPCPSDGLPVMGKVPYVEGAYISCGHNCWGILWAPASGLAIAELVATGASTTINLNHFSPGRFDNTGKRDRRGKKIGTVEVGEQW